MATFAIDPGPLCPADKALVARVFNSASGDSEQERRCRRWLGAWVGTAYGLDRTPDVQPPPPSRWARLGDRTSPSGRVLFRCGGCGRDSVTCDKSCPVGCGG